MIHTLLLIFFLGSLRWIGISGVLFFWFSNFMYIFSVLFSSLLFACLFGFIVSLVWVHRDWVGWIMNCMEGNTLFSREPTLAVF